MRRSIRGLRIGPEGVPVKTRFGVLGFLAAAVLAATIVAPALAAAQPGSGKDFVQRHGPNLTLAGKPFRFAGTNNYYLMYKSQYMVDDVLQTAATNGFTVIRTWGWLESVQEGVNFQSWNGSQPAYNDGATGLQHLDYVIAKAGQLGLKLVIPFTNNWSDFGGMDAYVGWAGDSYHDSFYTDPVIKQWYKNWISHLLNHVNTITGVAYRNDPAIMTWELANEPRCVGSGGFPRSASCTTATITNWAAEMSAYIKSIDHKQLTSSGSEGFLNIPGSTDGVRNGSDGVDELAISRLPTIDVMSYHLYPDSWTKDLPWATTWIKDHIKLAQKIGKPSMLGEYGLKDKTIRNTVYKSWTDTVLFSGGTGALYWILSGHNDDGTLYGDYDGFTVYCPTPVCTTIANFAKAMKKPFLWLTFKPVADVDSAVVEFGQSAILPVAANDIAYGRHNKVLPRTIDLDPATAGQQKSIAVTGGTFALQADGTVVFTPDAGFHGKVTASYTIQDKLHRLSNAPALTVLVKPLPGVPIQLFSFETGIGGWTGAVSQSTAWASDGTHSLLDNATRAWVSGAFSPPLDLSTGYSVITIDAMNGVDSWGFIKISIQTGSGYTWCENTGESLQPSSSGPFTATLDLSTTTCDLSDIRQMNVYVSTATYIDNILAR
jgi:mannan endo-1,4-beta-mannosidase